MLGRVQRDVGRGSVHRLRGGRVQGCDGGSRVLNVSCRDELCVGEQQVDGLHVLGWVQRDIVRGGVRGVRCGHVQGRDGGRGVLDVSYGDELSIGE